MISAPEQNPQTPPKQTESLQSVSVNSKHYNAFWPVFIVFFFFTVTAIIQLISNIQAKSNLNAALVQLSKGVAQAKAKGAALNALAHDLIELAPTSSAAQQIVTDFRIQMKAAPNKVSAPASQPPAAAPTPAASEPTPASPAPKQ